MLWPQSWYVSSANNGKQKRSLLKRVAEQARKDWLPGLSAVGAHRVHPLSPLAAAFVEMLRDREWLVKPSDAIVLPGG